MKKKSIKNLSILYKVIIPVIFFIILAFLAFTIYFQKGLIIKDLERNLEETYLTVQKLYNLEISEIKTKTSIAAASIANNPEILTSYEAYYRSYNIDSSSKIIAPFLTKFLPSLEENIHRNIHVHLHIPPGISFYRSWSDVIGDDQSNRSILNELYSTQNPITNIEIINNGIVCNSIYPVMDEGNTLLGSVEVIASLDNTLNNLLIEDNTVISVSLLKDNWNALGQDISVDNTNDIFKDFRITSNDYGKIQTDLINNDTLLKATKKSILFRKNNYYFILLPVVNFKNVALGVLIHQTDITPALANYKKLQIVFSGIIIFILLATLIILIISLRKAIIIPFNQIIKTLKGLTNGEHNRRIRIKSNDEIGKIKRSINRLNEHLINVENFAHEIGEGKLDAVFKTRSKRDTLAFTLLDMREKLRKARKDEENRRNEEKKREWQTKGIGVINNILRQYSHSGEELFYQVIGTVVKYIRAVQGGIFIINDEEEYLILKGCYAYDRNKYLQKKVHVKEGLIGRCYQEKEPVNLSNIPESYLKIVSGVGEKSPSNLLLVPLMHDEKVKGIIEIASFTAFEDHIIDFIKELTHQLSSALNDIEYSEKTKKLLEESRDKEQKLTQQEEEMRQNMEEMKATQEEFGRKEKELLKRIEELEDLSN